MEKYIKPEIKKVVVGHTQHMLAGSNPTVGTDYSGTVILAREFNFDIYADEESGDGDSKDDDDEFYDDEEE